MSNFQGWVEFSEGVYWVGPGGITRFEPIVIYTMDGKKSPYITTLFSATGKVTVVKNSLDEILGMLYNSSKGES